MTKIIPAILATTEEDYQEKINRINAEPSLFDWVQVDLMDSKFVQNKSIGPEIIAKYPTGALIEAHLMVEYPEEWLEGLFEAEVGRIIFPVENEEGISETINHIKEHGVQVGLSVNPGTDLKLLEPYLDQVDLILIMSVNPGFGGQEFIPETFKRIEEINQIRLKQDMKFMIEIDGGVSEENVRQAVEAGADFLVVGSHLFKYDKLEVGLEKLSHSANG